MTDAHPTKQEPVLPTLEQVKSCRYCTGISTENAKTPVQCTKFSGSTTAISVNLFTCLTCGEYEKTS